MLAFLPALIVVLGVAFKLTTPEQRQRLLALLMAVLRQLWAAERRRQADLAPFREALRARTPWVLVVPAIALLDCAIFAGMLGDAGATSDPATLVSWGGSIATRTTNAEWWRLLTSVFVHTGFVHLLVCVAGVVQAGMLVERAVGHPAVAAVYAAAGTVASLVVLEEQPLMVSVGGSGAVFGIYGALVAVTAAGMVQTTATKIPLRALKGLIPAVGLFLLYHLATGRLDSTATLAACGTGVTMGFVFTLGTRDRKPALRRTAAATAAAALVVAGAAVPLRGVTDVRPELQRIVEMETRTAAQYWKATERLQARKITAEALATMIDGTIRPELEAARERLLGLTGVLPEQQPLVNAAHAYCRLREESWRLRAEGLRRTNMLRLRQAESAERSALEALHLTNPQ